MEVDLNKIADQHADEDANVIHREYLRITEQVFTEMKLQESEKMRRCEALRDQITALAGKKLMEEYEDAEYYLQEKRNLMLFRRAMRLCFNFFFDFLPNRHDDK